MTTENSPTTMSINSIPTAPLDTSVEEGATTRFIENQTAKIPSVGFLSLAVGSMVLSTAIGVQGGKERGWLANFVGQWAPCFMLLGIYNKIVKVEAELARARMH